MSIANNAQPMKPILQLRLLGTLELLIDNRALNSLRSQKAVTLLVYLACNPGPQNREILADLLWDASSTAQSLSNLRTLLSRLRRQLGDYLVITPETLALVPAPAIHLDVTAFETISATPSAVLSPANAAHLEKLLTLYRGDFLADFHLPSAPGFEQWLVVERERLRFIAARGFQRLVDHYLHTANYPAGIRIASRWQGLEPLDEDVCGQQMRLLTHSGQRAAALRYYASFRQKLINELAVEPGLELQELHNQISAGEREGLMPRPVESVSAPASLRNLPRRRTSFVGRSEESSALQKLLAEPTTRLVTLVGEGGVGKSSLAVSVGEAINQRWQDGVHFVPLAEVDAEPLTSLSYRLAVALAQAVGLAFSTASGVAEVLEQLVGFLRSHSLLLILDNFEHSKPRASFVSDLLEAAPGCQVLITSREPLFVPGEMVMRLGGLSTPPDEASLPLPHLAYASMALFVERARQRQSSFSLAAINRSALVRLCQLVAGNPLALELAATWIEHFSLEEMVALLEKESLTFLHSPQPNAAKRHGSMRQVVETSWHLLDPASQDMLAQLSIFHGRFHREAALAVTGGSLEILAHLVDVSLLHQREAGRYELHTIIRQFAAEQLGTIGGRGWESRKRHAHFYLTLVGRVERTQTQIAQMTEDLANIRQAWAWAVEEKDVIGLARASNGLVNFYLRKGLFQEADDVFGRAITAALAVSPNTAGRQDALAALRVAQAVFLNIHSHYAEAIDVAAEAVKYGLQEENEAVIARGYLQWGIGQYRQGRYTVAAKQFQMALIAAENAGLAGDEADIVRQLGVTRLEQGDFAAARSHSEAALAIYRRTGNRLGEGNSLTDLGWINQRQQKFEEARFYFEEARQTHLSIDNHHGATIALLNLGIVQQMMGEFSSAYQIYQRLYREMNDVPNPYHHSLVHHSLGVLLSRMGDYPAARRHLMTALQINRSIGDQGGQAWSYNALGLLFNHLGEPKTGLAYHRQALTIGQAQGARTAAGISLLGIGQDLFELGLWEEARMAYEEALVLQADLKQEVRVIESRSGLARTLLALNQHDAALAQVEQILAYLSVGSLQGMAQPSLILWNSYLVLRAQDDPRTAVVLSQAFELIHKQAAGIQEERLRQSYLHALPPHKEIIQEVESLRLSPQLIGIDSQIG